jgi:ABC-type maltose transport system permease subunit
LPFPPRQSILTWSISWNEFIMALILITRNHLMTLPLGLLSFQGQFETNWGAMGTAMVIASLPTVALHRPATPTRLFARNSCLVGSKTAIDNRLHAGYP